MKYLKHLVLSFKCNGPRIYLYKINGFFFFLNQASRKHTYKWLNIWELHQY